MTLFRPWFLLLTLFLSIRIHANPLMQSQSFMGDLLELSKISKSSEGAHNEESKKLIDKISSRIDLELLAKTSLAPRWTSLQKKDREEFKKLLKELLELVAYPKAKNINVKENEILYEALPQNPLQVAIKAPYQREKNGDLIKDKVEIVLLYNQKENGKVTDAILEGELLSQNLKRQFDRALEKKTFQDILASMQKRVADLKNPQPKSGSSGLQQKSNSPTEKLQR